jgi:prolyl oligopeptidase
MEEIMHKARSETIFRLFLVGLFTLGCATSCSHAPKGGTHVESEGFEYPLTPRMSQVDVYHGVRVVDPYRWLEDLDSEETAEWVRSQNEISRPYLESIPERDRIKDRITDLWDYERYGVPFKEGDRYFFSRNSGLQNQDVLYVAESLAAKARVLIDPNTFSEDATIALAEYSVSRDGRWIAYGLSDGGSDWKTWKVRNVETGEDAGDFLDFIKFTDASWAYDSEGFYYSRYPQGADGKGDGSAGVSVYYHKIGDDQSSDKLVYSMPDGSLRSPYGTVTEDGRYLILNIFEGYDANAVYYLDIAHAGLPVVRLLDDWDALYDFIGNEGSVFYFQTTNGAPLGRVVAIDTKDPHSSQWRTVVPEAEETLRSASYVGGLFVARYLKDAQSQVKVFDSRGGLVREVTLPGVGTAYGFGGHADDPETFYAFTSFTAPVKIFRYDVHTGHTKPFAGVQSAHTRVGIDPEAYETKQVFYTSKDGTRVPMFLVHRKGLRLDGQNPTMLYGYGGFNVSLTPSYRVNRVVWVEMGGVLAIPNLRGGGEYGEDWHLAGTKLEKQNVFDDFIAAAEWLIEHRYTSTPKLAIAGASNGGLLVAAVMTQRPELFGAALPDVGVLDMLRYHLPSSNARQWSSDYGLSENEDEFHALYAYSPYHRLKKGTCYPPTLVTTADHDDRVVPWHSFKFGAELQHVQGCASPVLVRVETRAGHGAGMPTWMRIENYADQLAFLVKTLEM